MAIGPDSRIRHLFDEDKLDECRGLLEFIRCRKLNLSFLEVMTYIPIQLF